MEILIGFGTIIIGLITLFLILGMIGLFFDSNTGPAILAIVFWSIIAYYIGKFILSLL